MTKIGVFSNPAAAAVGVGAATRPYSGDDSEVFETADVYSTKKTLRFIKDPNIFSPGSLVLGAELKTTEGSYDLGIFINGSNAFNITGAENSYTLKSYSYDLGALGNAIHTLDFKLRNIGQGTSANKLLDVYFY